MRHGADARLSLAAVLGKPIETFGGPRPFWAKDIKVGFGNINAKAEGIEGKPAFREAFQRRRCLVPVDNFTSGRRPRPGSSPTPSH